MGRLMIHALREYVEWHNEFYGEYMDLDIDEHLQEKRYEEARLRNLKLLDEVLEHTFLDMSIQSDDQPRGVVTSAVELSEKLKLLLE